MKEKTRYKTFFLTTVAYFPLFLLYTWHFELAQLSSHLTNGFFMIPSIYVYHIIMYLFIINTAINYYVMTELMIYE